MSEIKSKIPEVEYERVGTELVEKTVHSQSYSIDEINKHIENFEKTLAVWEEKKAMYEELGKKVK